jgi:hypothetical protein
MAEAVERVCALCFSDPGEEASLVDGDPLCARHAKEIAAIQLVEIIQHLEDLNWSRVDGMGAVEAAQLVQRLREAHIATLPSADPVPGGGHR